MKIEDNRTNRVVAFRDLSSGDCFTRDGKHYIKLDSVNAFNLERNSVDIFESGKSVIPVNAKVVIE